MLELIPLKEEFAVCQVGAVDLSRLGGGFFALAQTGEELSLVCETHHVPPDAEEAEHGWRALRVAGTLDFGVVGVIAGISAALAAEGIPIFVVSTYNTDYVLLKDENLTRALGALRGAGYAIGGSHGP